MFEFHGWANIIANGDDDVDTMTLEALVAELRLRWAPLAESCNGRFEIVEGVNGQAHLLLTGFHNHRDPRIRELFDWIAANQPHSYGILHVWDDESTDSNAFISHAVARGRVTSVVDSQLSPCIPKLEAPYVDKEQ